MVRILIVLRQFLADLTRRAADNRVGVGIVIRWPPEDIDAQRALLQVVSLAGQDALGDMAQQRLAPVTAAEERTVQDAPYLRPDPLLLQAFQPRWRLGITIVGHFYSPMHVKGRNVRPIQPGFPASKLPQKTVFMTILSVNYCTLLGTP